MIDRQLLRILRDSIDKAILDLGKEHGVFLETGNATFNNNNCTFKIEVSQIAGGFVMTKEAVAYQRLNVHDAIGFQLFEEFTHKGRGFRVMGYKPRATKRPVVCLNLGSKELHVFPVEVLRSIGMPAS